jgi:hypothetical protein
MCQKFLDQDSDPNMSGNAKKWMRGVRQCLQDAAVRLAYDKSLSCDQLETEAFASHPDCYYAPGNDICTTPSVWSNVVKAVGIKTLFNPKVVANEVDVMAKCGMQAARAVAPFLAAAVFPFGWQLLLVNNLAEKAIAALYTGFYQYQQGGNKVGKSTSSLGMSALGAGEDPRVAGMHDLLSQLGQVYGNFSVNQSSVALSNLTLASRTFQDRSMWQVEVKGTSITARLKTKTVVVFEDKFSALASAWAAGDPDELGSGLVEIMCAVAGPCEPSSTSATVISLRVGVAAGPGKGAEAAAVTSRSQQGAQQPQQQGPSPRANHIGVSILLVGGLVAGVAGVAGLAAMADSQRRRSKSRGATAPMLDLEDPHTPQPQPQQQHGSEVAHADYVAVL